MHDIAEFLRGRHPFSGLDEGELDRLAARTEVEFFAAGSPIPAADSGQDVIRVVRRGAVELVTDGRPIDLLEEGELFGWPLTSAEAQIPAQAAEDTLTYALPAPEVVPLLLREPRRGAEPTGVTGAPASEFVRGPALVLPPDTPLREAARAMEERGVGVALIGGRRKLSGILTDRDLRSRVATGDLSGEAPVTEAMSAPVISSTSDRSASEVILLMLEHDVHHIPVLSERSEPIGIIESIDLLAAEGRDPFLVRRAISLARTRGELHEAAAALSPMVVAMHRTGITATRISEAISVVTDSLVRRAIDLSVGDAGGAPADFAWLALGSHGRREPVPSSDLDSGMAWRSATGGGDETIRSYLQGIAGAVEACLREVGRRTDPHGVTASGDFSASSMAEWEAAIADWLARQPTGPIALAIAITMDARVVRGPQELDPRVFLWEGESRDRLLRSMLRSAIATSPPTGFLRDLVVERSGEHRGTLDLKRGGLGPVVDLARFAALEARTPAGSTIVRLREAAAAGTLAHEDASALERAFELFSDLRMTHQVEQLESGTPPDDHLDPRMLDPLTKRYLRDAFREVAAVQRSFARKLDLGRGRI